MTMCMWPFFIFINLCKVRVEAVSNVDLLKRREVVDPLNPNPDEDDLPEHMRSSAALLRKGATAHGVVTRPRTSGKAYPSPGEVLRHNAMMQKADVHATFNGAYIR